jgi:phage tail sheath protein FI
MDSLEAFQQYVMCTPDAVGGANNTTDSYVEQKYVRPDVVTYTILITSILKSAATKTNRNYAATLLQQTTNKTEQNQAEMGSYTVVTATKRAQILYDDMLLTWNIIPDKALIDW